MKWFKHNSDAIKDEKIQMAMDSGGIAAYGLYFIICELCSEKIEADNMSPKIEITSKRLREWSHIYHHQSMTNLLVILHNLSLIFVESISNLQKSDKNVLVISVPNLLKRLDNWTNRYVVATKQVTIEEEQEVKNKNKKNINPLEGVPLKTKIHPTQEEAVAYFKEKGLPDEGVNFWEFYEMRGWVQGNSKIPIKKWQMAANRWIKSNTKQGKDHYAGLPNQKF